MVSAVTMHHTHLVDNQGRAEPPRYVQLGSTWRGALPSLRDSDRRRNVLTRVLQLVVNGGW